MAEVKTCTTCRAPKPASEFYRERGACKQCRRAYQKQYRAANAERCSAGEAKWRLAHKDRLRTLAARWALANKEKIKMLNRDWQQSHREQKNATNRAWRARNREAAKASSAAWRAAHPKKRRAASIASYRKSRDALLDSYIRRLFTKWGLQSTASVPAELISLRREHLLLRRAIKETEDAIKQRTKN